MTALHQQLFSMLKAAPFFERLDSADIARLIPYIELQEFAAGESIFNKNQPADTLYLLQNGEVSLHNESWPNIQIQQGYFGEELLLNNSTYLSGAKATEHGCRVLVFHGEDVKRILKHDAELLQLFIQSFLDRKNSNDNIERSSKPYLPVKKSSVFDLCGWLLICLIPILFYSINDVIGLSENTRIFVSIFLVSIVMWAFKLVPDYIAGMLSILVVLVLGIAPSEVVLSGFQSSGFFMAMSIFVLAVIVVDSGLIYRLSLLLLKVTPCSSFFYNVLLTLIGLLFTPILPSTNGRVGLVTPLLKDMFSSLKFNSKSSGANQITLSAFYGVSLFSSVFLTSKTINFLVFSMLPTQEQDNFQWGDWTMAAGVSGLTLLVLFILSNQLLFKSHEKPHIDKNKVHLQLKILGKMSLKEWGAVLGIFLLVAGIVTTSVHKIKPAWIGMAIMLIFLALGTLSKKAFREKIDWPFLFLLAALIGLTKTLNHLGLDKILADQLGGLQSLMSDSFGLFILVLFGVILVLRMALSINATIVIVCSVFLPLANNAGINMWVLGFIILTLSEVFLLPYQCSYYVMFRSQLQPSPFYSEKKFLYFNWWICLLRLMAIYVSIPVWQAMEIL